MVSALQALFLSAQLAGISPDTASPSLSFHGVPVEPQGGLRVVSKISLDKISLRQKSAFLTRPAGQGAMDFSLGFAPDTELWLKFRQDNQRQKLTGAYPFASVQKGFVSRFPLGYYRIWSKDGLIHADPATGPTEPKASVSLTEVFESLLNRCVTIRIGPITYAILREDGALLPASVSLLRKDTAGRYWVTYNADKDLSQIQWFVSVDGVLYGLRREGETLAFYSKPATSLAPPSLETSVF